MSTSPAHAPVPANEKLAELERDALAARGTDNQRARHKAGVLPEDELLAVARAELFAPFNAFTQWHNRNLKPSAVRHKERHCHGRIDFETAEPDELTHEQWEALAQIKAAAEIAADHHWVTRSLNEAAERSGILAANMRSVIVEPLAHWATCEKCGAEEVRASVKITILWAGRSLAREYAL